MLTRSILTAAVALFAAEASAFWRMDCGHLSFERVDPIDAPGKPAGHSHAVLGANNFNKLSNHTSLLDAECTTCQVVPDKSSYWVPNLYWQDDETKELTAVKTTGTTVYYFIRNNGVNPVKAFPPGFRMIGGHNKKRKSEFRKPVYDPKSVTTAGALSGASQAELQEYSLGFNCMDFISGKNEDTMARPVIPQPCHTPQDDTHKQCSSGMRAEIYFPSCWNGEDLDSDDHKSHVAYPSHVQDGDCPESHPVRLPSLLFETWYTTEPVNEKVNAGKSGQFVLSNGDTTGWGYHADFMNGWDQDLLEEALDKCTNLSGNVKDCEVFTRDGNLQPINTGTCEKKHWDFPDEDCEGPIKELPGNNPIGETPADSDDDESDDESDDITEADTFATHDDGAPAGDGAGVDVPAAADSVTVDAAAKTVTEVAPAETMYQAYRKHKRHAHRL